MSKSKLKKRSGRIKTATLFEFPPDVVLGGVNLCIFENIGCVIENYLDVISYSSEAIRIKTKIGVIRLEGKQFNIEVMTADSISITGVLSNIKYEDFENG